jgi:hypothetical protein
VVWTGLSWLWVGTSGGSYEHVNEPSGSIKFWETLEWVLKKGSAPRSLLVRYLLIQIKIK